MDIKLLKNDILTNNIPNFLIFLEEEPALSKQYIQHISSTLNKPYKYYDTADEVIYDTSTNLREDFVYIIYNDNKVLKNENYVKELSSIDRNIIVVFSDIDKKSDFYKNNKKYIVAFEKLDLYSILAYAQKLCKVNKVNIEQEKLIRLIENCDCCLGCVMNELDKIFILGQENSNILVDYMNKNGFPDYRKTNVYSFVNKVLSRDKTMFVDLMKIDESPVGIIYLIYNNARKRLIDTRNPLYGFIMQKCFEVYNGIIDGSMSDEYALKYMVVCIMNYS